MKRLIYFLILALVLGVGAWSQANAADTSIVSHQASQEEMQATAAYWTPERMRAAKPYPLPALTGAPGVGPTEAAPTGPPGAVKSSAGQTSALLSEDEFDALAYTGAFAEPATPVPMTNGYDYPPPHNTFNVTKGFYGTTSSKFPYKAIGKVFFYRAPYNYVCSGSSIGGRAVLTAGHCVSYGAGTWSSNVLFVPSYKNGAAPYGTWTKYLQSTFTAWHTSGDYAMDVGFIVTNNISGLKLSQRVGNLGFAWDQSRVQMYNMFGYPANPPYDGKWLVTTQASYARQDGSFSPNTTGIGTSQTGGCSGGPWIWVFRHAQSGANNYANGLNSYVYLGSENQVYSPYFDTAVKDFWTDMIIK